MNTMLIRTLLLSLLIASVPLSGFAKDKGTISICGTTWGKLGGEHLPGKGIVPDLVARVFRHAGYRVEAHIVPWPKCVEDAKKQRFDLIASAWRGDNFEPHFDYLNVILLDTINFITLEGSAITEGDMANFYGKRVGIVREAGGLEALFKGHESVNLINVGKLERLPVMLQKGRFTAIVSDPVSLNEAVKALDPPFEAKLVALQPPLKTNLNSPMVAKGHPRKAELMTDFDRAYRELKSKGLYEELIRVHDLQMQYPE